MRLALVLALLLTGCATPTKPPPTVAWSPNADWWQAASVRGARLTEKDGTTHHLSSAQIRNISETYEKLSKESSISARLVIVKSENVNAFATYRNAVAYIGFTIPFIRELGDDKDAVASVMGHELAHLKLEHGALRQQRNQTANVAGNIVGTLLNVAGVPLGGTIAGLGATAVTSAFSRDEEREADELGNKWALAAGYDPCGGVRSMRLLQARSTAVQIPLLSSHPGHEERIERANALSVAIRGKSC